MATDYRVEGAELDRTEVMPLLARRSSRQVLVKADAGLDFGMIAGVIDAGQAAGAENVELITPAIEGAHR